jgi:SAM-dependent methyltransferase
MSEIETSYDRVAADFATEFIDELSRKPFDRRILDRFAERVRGQGTVCDIGCGPGQIARYLKDRRVAMRGIDLSAQMVKIAALRNPDIPFERGDMLEVSLPPASMAGIVCFYSLIHLRREDAPRALARMSAALRPGGRLLVAFHGGEGTMHRDEWYHKPISIDVTLFEGAEMVRYLEDAGLHVEDIVEREAYEFEYPTRRLYAVAARPSGR